MSTGLKPGILFAGRYRVVRAIATGGMGAVYEVIHLETERRRALKVMLPHVLQSAELRERFQREAKVAAHVDSDYIVDVFDAGFDEETAMPFLVMELLRGEELGRRLERQGRLPAGDVIAYLHQTALALDKTHRASIVHRDLKPENLFLTQRDDGPPRIKVLDFGIAKVIAESATSGGATQGFGTPLYMAPEQLNPLAPLTGAADRFALAMVAFTLLVGMPYWGEEARAGNLLALAMVAVNGPREPPRARAASYGVTLPPGFDAWFARAAAVDPARRFPSCVEMIGALAQVFGAAPPARMMAVSSDALPAPSAFTGPASVGAPITAPATTTTGARSTGSSRGLAIGLAAVAIAIIAAVGLLAFGGRSPAPADPVAARAPEPLVPAVSAAPTAAPVESAAASASTIDADEPPPAAAPASARPTPAASAPAKPATSVKAPPSAQRKRMWGRD